jgi:hypothetical protein
VFKEGTRRRDLRKKDYIRGRYLRKVFEERKYSLKKIKF